MWKGTWSSDISEDVYGNLEINNINHINIIFEGGIYMPKIIKGNISNFPDTENMSGFKGDIKLLNTIGYITYQITSMSDDNISGAYYCTHPTDNGIFNLRQIYTTDNENWCVIS